MSWIMYAHPMLQTGSILVTIYVWWLGLQRFRSLHLGHKVRFARRRHAVLGALVLVTMALGALGALVLARWAWGGWLMTGAHGWLGLALLPLMALGLGTGWTLYSQPRPRKLLPLVHGVANTLLLLLLFYQAHLGEMVEEHFLEL